MSQRVKRPNRSDDGSVPVKRRKRPTTAQEEEEASSLASWRPSNDLKIYNRTTTEAPAELFRKDLISAMKLPDSEPLASDEYWVIVDQWKQEWEKGVQVPVNPDSLPEPSVTVTHCAPIHIKPIQEFKPPKTKYIRITKDDNFKPEEHMLSSAPAQAEAACSYDLDECDVTWLKLINSERLAAGLNLVTEDQLERVMERLELRCWDKIQAILRNEEGLGIEYDENVICDVCRSPDSEEGNEMVFCDSCNICVHQACYGITRIPEGQWLCCTCTISQRPDCVLCPNKGGAMKCTRSGQKWAHVSCALWIPEVSIGCVEKMEPITKISSIPQSRWALICVLCRERVGACIQCSVKTCKTAYHVTCAFKHGLEMRAIIEDENADDGVKLRSYCEKHSKSSKKEKSVCSGSEDDDCKRKKRKDMTSEEKNQARAARLQEIEAEFYKHVSQKDIAVHIDVDSEALQYIYNYWKLKRKAGHNKPLLPPKSEDVDMLSHKQEQADLEKMKMFVQLRQDLERVRNLCYMVSRREKLSRSFFKMREQTFHKQTAVLQSGGTSLAPTVIQAVIEANHGPSIYDRLYSHNESEEYAIKFDTLVARIAGIKSPPHDSSDEKKPEINGLFKDVKNNPYKKMYFNGSSKRRSGSLYGSSMSSASSSDEKPKDNKENRLHSTSEEEKPFAKKKISPTKNSTKTTERRKKRISITRSKLDSSSEDDIKPVKKDWQMSSLKQFERELGVSASDSDELMPIKPSSQEKKAISSIYSDSDSSDISLRNDDKSSNAASDSQSQSKLRTKAAVKEFSNKPSTSKSPNKSSPENKKKTKEEPVKKEIKKKDYVPSDLIVPQRQAAKKATENLKSTTTARVNKEQNVTASVDTASETKSPITKEEKEKEKEKDKDKEREKEKITKPKAKVGRPPKESKEDIKASKEEKVVKKDVRKDDVFDIDKELDKNDQDILAYVPQRQAAKKAAEHIKSGMGKPGSIEASVTEDKTKKDSPDEKERKKEIFRKDKDVDHKSNKEIKENKEIKDTKEIKEMIEIKESKEIKEADIKEVKEPAKISDKRKSSSNSSTSSSSSSSSDSTSSSSSDSEEDSPTTKKPQSESSFSPREQAKRTGAKDWPFLDKGAKSAASSTFSDSSDSSRPSSPRLKNNEPKELPRTPKQTTRTSPNKSSRKAPDKKPTPPEREEQTRALRGKGRASRGRPRSTNAGDRCGDVNVGTRDIVECGPPETDRVTGKTRKGKPDEVVEHEQKEVVKSPEKLLSPVRKADKKLNDAVEPEISDLEKEILERKAASNKVINKSKLDKLNKLPDKLNKSPVKENKEPVVKQPSPVKKSPIKAKSIDDIFANKISVGILKSPEQVVEHKSPKKNHIFLPEPKEETNYISVDIFKVETQKYLEEFNNSSLKETQTRSIFSPNDKDDILADIDNMLDDDGFGKSKDKDMKLPLTFAIVNSTIFKEDSKEDSARETLNLVEKLRMGMGKGKKSSYDIDDSVSVASSTKNDNDRLDFNEQIVPNNVIETPLKEETKEIPPQINLEMRVEVTNTAYEEEKEEYNKFINCEPTIQLDINKSVPETQHQHLDGTAQADERWVPPSDSYPNLQSADAKVFNVHIPEVISYMQSYDSQHSIIPQVDNKVQDDILKSESPNVHDRRVTRTPFLDPASMDCMPSPSPYADMHPQAKWADSQVMPTRRSTSSSPSSIASTGSRRNIQEDEMLKQQDMLMMAHSNVDGMPFGVLPSTLPVFPPNSLNSIDSYPQFSEASQFVNNAVSLFPPGNINTQIPFPSPGAGMYPPVYPASFPNPHSGMPPIPKPMDDGMHFTPTPCTAAFTSSQHNMALTAAMANLLPVTTNQKEDIVEEKPIEPVDIEPPPPTVISEEVPPSPAQSISTPNHVEPSPNPSLKSNSSVGKKSPSKPTRTSARFISQQSKSPSKSPGKSPRQEIPKQSGPGRGRDNKKSNHKGSSGRGSQSQARGRGRGRGRGRAVHAQHDYDYSNANTLHNRLVGTVYDLDFEDDMSNEMGDLRTMRERRKSADIHERKTEALHVSRDSSESPKFTSPAHKGRSYNTDFSELRPPTPITEEHSKPASPEPPPEEPKTFPSIVQPVLPGPVDMRTYNSTFDTQKYNESNLLDSFGTAATEQPAHEELDEIFEKELHNALTQKPEEHQVPEISNMKVSLSDSRNQLKVKIKGPIANYTSTVTTLPPVSDTTATVPPISISTNHSMNMSTNTGSGTPNLRRMRKKELLRQYVAMNMDDPGNTGFKAAPVQQSLCRTTISIPKAVASMTCFPTKDDYRVYRTGSDELFETKIRKEKPARPGLSRELKQLDISLDEDNSLERRRSIGSNNSNSGFSSFDNNISGKGRRGRPPRPSQTTPKLKIKIGTSIVGGSKVDDKKDRIRPPKKRLSATAAKPSVEDLKRESMKFRKMVMADFGEEKKEKKKKDKSNKKSKKKKKQEVQIIQSSNEGKNAPKLIIRFGKKIDTERTSNLDVPAEQCKEIKKDVEGVSNKDSERTEGSNPNVDSTIPMHLVRSNKVTPIKLKLSRCQEGSGYVMKTPPPEEEKPPPAPPPLISSTPTVNLPEPPPPVHTSTPLPLNKDCEVR